MCSKNLARPRLLISSLVPIEQLDTSARRYFCWSLDSVGMHAVYESVEFADCLFSGGFEVFDQVVCGGMFCCLRNVVQYCV